VKTPRIVNFLAGLALGFSAMAPMPAVQAATYSSPLFTFSIDDVQGDFQGNTFGGTTATGGTIPADRTILCDAPGSTVNCATTTSGILPITDTKLVGQPITLYPVDSEFGYEVIDFLGAAQKTRDDDYAEGFVGNVTTGFPTQADIDGTIYNFTNAGSTSIYDAPITGGVAVSNAATDTYKVKPPMGTWCRGLGGNSVKCETEHYSVMEHILTCHELIPYFFADPVTGTQAVLNPGSVDIPTLAEFDCADAGLDDIALILVGGTPGPQLVDGTPCEAVNDPVGCQMFPNDKTDTQNNVALTSDYSVQLKDDGKALYGWGTIHKRPNDVRLYASLPLPAEWKVPGANYIINSAKLIVRHHITNNPNDQLRPEDLENEAATGRKPSYRIENAGTATETWKSTKACFEGDSDLIDTEDGNVDPTFLGVGTVFKNTWFAITTSPPTSNVPTNDTDLPYPLSSDLREALTNAWYTTVDRDPFAWSYDINPDPNIQDYVGTWLEDPTIVGELVSGPRWRLKPNKYGQDLPGLEIAIDALPGQGTDGADCYAPPFDKALIKYPVGEPTITEIDLLDWETATTSPLAYSRGWIDVTQNGAVTVAGTNNGVPYTTNGLPMTDDFDLAVYIKGDRKATAVYDAQLVIDYSPAPQVVVPDVVDLPQATAEADILAAGLVVGTITTASHPSIVAGNVISQNPIAGTTVFAGTAVDLVISTGPGIVLIDVPDVTGQTQAAAEAAILAANLTVGNITTASDPVVPAGSVISQNPVACVACVTAGTAVDLVVSTGPAILSDVSLEWGRIPARVSTSNSTLIIYKITNASTAQAAATGTVTLTGSDGSSFTASFTNLAPGALQRVAEIWLSPGTPQTVNWTLTATVSGVVVDTLTASTVVQ
jgi:hypothetical protein